VKASNVNAEVFIRTTEERHRIAVEQVWVNPPFLPLTPRD